ncbi:hypothetical protein C6V04_00250 [Burkholderia multivorans]|nr:hypothetical protein C6V04_00250 [Burkholderia multivorans]RSB72753.1 hypothetical protein EGT33_16125 [Burkholderia multivorans]
MRIHQTVDCARIPAARARTKKDPARTSGPGPVALRAFGVFPRPVRRPCAARGNRRTPRRCARRAGDARRPRS